MRSFIDEAGQDWIVTAREEETPRHHGRWYLLFHPAADTGQALPMPEVQWQTRETAERTILSLSESELRRRLRVVRARTPHRAPLDPAPAA
jgi:hypothetical protein